MNYTDTPPHEWTANGVWRCLRCGVTSPDPCTCKCHEPDFEGHTQRDCGEHRSVGPHRAWCFECNEWCYPAGPCKGCELPQARALANVSAEKIQRLELRPGEILALIGEFSPQSLPSIKRQFDDLIPDIKIAVFPTGTTFAVIKPNEHTYKAGGSV